MTFQQKLSSLMKALVKKGSREPLSEKEIGAVLKALDEAHSASAASAKTQAAHDTAIAALRAENQALLDAAQQSELQAGHLRQEISGLRGALDELYSSTSWKASAPLRRVKKTLRPSLKTSAAITGISAANAEPLAAETDVAPANEITTDTRAGSIAGEIYVPRDTRAPSGALPASLFAFYLPQFHPIAENNEWWGEGFTEWSNVKPAKPLYEGHYQPHVPDPAGALGYYDLRETSKVMGEQISLARQYGVEGFCFYFYWFAGHRLLETPLLNLLADTNLDVPFCLCWANENWSRRWDGRDSELLMTQDNTPEDDIAFISYVSKYLKDPRYRRIEGKPLLLVYRPIELPDAKATATRWREWCRENGVGEIYLAYTQSFENNDPREYGFDGAVEFPPNNSAPPDLTDTVTPLSDDFGGKVYDWDIFPTRSDDYAVPDYPLFRTVCPAWDNTARRKENGTVFAGSTPQRYQHWLANAVTDSCARIPSRQDRLIFVNAWNEWAEGAHLEPDARYGHAYLAATRGALENHKDSHKLPLAAPHNEDESEGERKIAIVSHDAYPHGAQYLALNLAKTFSEDFDYSVDMVVLGDGPMTEDFALYATVHDLAGVDPRGESAHELARSFKAQGISAVICNTAVSGHFAQTLKEAGLHVTCLIHELSSVITQYGLEPHVEKIARYADKIVFPAPLVRDNFTAISGPLGDKAVMRPQGAYKVNRHRTLADITSAKAELRKTLGLSPRSKIVLGVGYADTRKGFDFFLTSAETLTPSKTDIVYLWLGHQEPYIEPALQARMDALTASGRLILPGRVSDTDLYYAASDVYLLTSREDPYPSTVLEALDVGLNVIGFEGVTGSTDLIAQSGGLIVPAFDIEALNRAAVRALITADMETQSATLEVFRARSDISFSGYAEDLINLPSGPAKTVSAVVPNYNYAHFLKDRVASITSQSHAVAEIIILDDCSSDNSPDVIREICERSPVPARFIQNKKNSGSVFAQWLKGIEAAQSEYVWIAEADDLALPEFLKTALSGFTSSSVVMSYTQSKQMSEAGDILDDSYRAYVADISAQQWSADYARLGTDEITQGLSVKNSVPNVSGVVFRREDILHVLRTHMNHIQSYRVAGDWAAYVHLLARGNIAFHAAPLNLHRRHDQSVTNARFGPKELDEIIRMQRFVDTEYSVSPDYQAKARAYIETLKAQFGLGHIEAAQ